jgi:ubiquinone/menaquinone biosynthesis C-methylase UbiE
MTVSGEWLTSADRALLDRILTNEADMAFRRRAVVLLDYLELADGLDVLDCGCGMGFYLKTIEALRSVQLTGVDSDASRLRMAEDYGVHANLVQGDASGLPFADASFDRVLMSEVLEHVPDDLGVLREIQRVLRPGGILAISVPHARYPFWWDPINATWTAFGGQPIRNGPIAGIWSNHERLYEPAQLAAVVRDAGLHIEALVESTHYSVPFIHFLVYGIGKPLIERQLLPPQLRASTDRFAGLENAGSVLNPFNAARALFRLVDRLNDRPEVARQRTFVNVLLKARNPRSA